MIALQVLSKVLTTQDNALILSNNLTKEYFVGYESEYEFIQEHFEKYGNIPDKATFLAKFPEIELVEVQESDRYLVDTIREEYLYNKSVPVVQEVARLLTLDANAASEYMLSQLPQLQPKYTTQGIDIIQQSQQRYEQYMERRERQRDWYFPTGFDELDKIIHGIERQEELMVLFARLGQGKSWILEKICMNVWNLGFNVGYISPEMSASSIGFRFDTLYKNYSNKSLLWGNDDIEDEGYKGYLEELAQNKNKFVVATTADFDRSVTVSKLRNFVKQNDLHLLAIDGIKYLTDERGKRNDNLTTTLTNVSEDLIQMSVELKIPILVVVQANRGGVLEQGEEGTPEIENIRDSDGIAQNATKVIALRQKQEGLLEMGIKKQRFGQTGGKLNYEWDINTGRFTFVPSYDDAQRKSDTEQSVRETQKRFTVREDVF